MSTPRRPSAPPLHAGAEHVGTPAASDPDARAGLSPEVSELLTRSPDGLVPAIVQDHASGRVLMMAWMDDRALAQTLATGRSTFFSRSRDRYWVKGEESGHRQWVRKVELDCDGDTLLLTVRQEGPACHTGAASCFDIHTIDSVTTDPQIADPQIDSGDPSPQA